MAQLMSIKRNVEMCPGQVSVPAIYHVSQGDKGTRIILGLVNNSANYTIPEGTTATIRGHRADGTLFTEITADVETTEVKFNLTEDMSAVPGRAECEAVLASGSANIIGTANFIIDVEKSPASIGSVFPGTDAAETWLIDELTNLDISDLDNESVVDAINNKASESTIAPEFDPSGSYTAGSYVYKNGVLYRFTSAHTGVWTGSDAVEVTVGKELTDLKADYDDIDDRVTALEGGGSGSGLTEDIKVALLACFEKVAWIDEDGQDYYDALYNALYPPIPATAISLNTNALSFATLNTTQTLTAILTPSDTTDTVSWLSSDNTVATVSNGVVTSVGYGTCTITATVGSVSATCSVTIAQATLSSISAVYTQSGTVYNTDSLDSLKTDLVVTATWSDSTTSTVSSNDYTLSGTLSVGTSTITVSYGVKTDTFTVTVTAMPVNPFDGVSWNDGLRISGSSEYTGQNNYSTTDYVDVSDISDVTIELTSTSGNVAYVIAWYSSNNNSSYLSNKNGYINYNSSTYFPSATSEKPSTASYCRICTTRASVSGTQGFPYAIGILDINVTFEE